MENQETALIITLLEKLQSRLESLLERVGFLEEKQEHILAKFASIGHSINTSRRIAVSQPATIGRDLKREQELLKSSPAFQTAPPSGIGDGAIRRS